MPFILQNNTLVPIKPYGNKIKDCPLMADIFKAKTAAVVSSAPVPNNHTTNRLVGQGEWQEVHHKKGKGKNVSNGSMLVSYAQTATVKPPLDPHT